MATDQKAPVYPGDIVQDSSGFLYVVSEVRGWGVGAVQRWNAPGGDDGRYFRLKPDEFVVCGVAHLMPEETRAARRASLAHAAEVAAEQAKAQEPGK